LARKNAISIHQTAGYHLDRWQGLSPPIATTLIRIELKLFSSNIIMISRIATMPRISSVIVVDLIQQWLLIPMLMLAVSAHAYSASVPMEARRVAVSFPHKEDLLTSAKAISSSPFTASHSASDARPATSRSKYSLGPLVTDDIATATQYLVEHDSVREYPSPLAVVKPSDTQPKAKKAHPPLIPNRLTDDSLLKIVAESPDEASSPVKSTLPPRVLVQPSMRSGRSFDINTAWIELLIHEQQTKFAPATTHAMNVPVN
jgi:hypothetical protein